MENKNLIVGSLFILLAGGSWWLVQTSGVEDSEHISAAHTPDYYVDNFTVSTMGPDGKPKQKLTADRMLHYPDDDSTELTRPHMVLYEADTPPWQVRSETGWVSGDGKLVLLNGEVKIDRAAAPGIRPIHIRTSDLRVRPEEKYAETDKTVRIRSLQSNQTSVGMQAWFNKPVRMKFLSNVRGHYEVK